MEKQQKPALTHTQRENLAKLKPSQRLNEYHRLQKAMGKKIKNKSKPAY
jgi:hypothetical protein